MKQVLFRGGEALHAVPTLGYKPKHLSRLIDEGRGMQLHQTPLHVVIYRKGAIAVCNHVILAIAGMIRMVVLGRALTVSEFGYFSITYSVFLFFQAIGMGAIYVPVASLAPRKRSGELQDFVTSMLFVQAGVGGCILLLCLGLSWSGSVWLAGETRKLTILAGLLYVASMYHDFSRTITHSQFEQGKTLCIDAIGVGVQIGGLFIVFMSDALHGWVMGLGILVTAEGIAAVVGMICVWKYVCMSNGLRPAHLREVYRFVRYSFFTYAGGYLWRHCNTVLLGAMMHVDAAGGYMAVGSLSRIGEPVVFGAANILIPTAAMSSGYQEGRQLRRIMRGVTGICALTLSVMAGVLLVAGGKLLAWVFRPEYTQYGTALGICAMSALVAGIGDCLVAMLTGWGHAKDVLKATWIAAVVGLACSVVLIPQYNVIGAALGTLTAAVVLTSLSYLYYLRRAEESSSVGEREVTQICPGKRAIDPA